jgi:hypothetical protein
MMLEQMPKTDPRQLRHMGSIVDDDVEPFWGALPGNPAQQCGIRLIPLVYGDPTLRIRKVHWLTIQAGYAAEGKPVSPQQQRSPALDPEFQ